MQYHCKLCHKFIKPKRKYKNLIPNVHKEFDKCKHKKLTIKNPDINNVDRVLYEYEIYHNKEIRLLPC